MEGVEEDPESLAPNEEGFDSVPSQVSLSEPEVVGYIGGYVDTPLSVRHPQRVVGWLGEWRSVGEEGGPRHVGVRGSGREGWRGGVGTAEMEVPGVGVRLPEPSVPLRRLL